MKKFMTVLLVVAVLFTFSFGSAFAAQTWTGEQTTKYLLDKEDFIGYNAADDVAKKYGAYGVTNAVKEAALADLEEDLYAIEDADFNDLYAPELAAAKTLCEAAIADVKAATTDKKVATIVNTYETKIAALDDKYDDYVDLIEAATEKVSATKLVTRYGSTNLHGAYLPGYITFAKTVDTAYASLGDDEKEAVVAYLMDNDYRATATEVTSGIKALNAALVPVTETYIRDFYNEKDVIQNKIYAYEDKYSSTPRDNQITSNDIAGIDALIGEMTAFAGKYYGLTYDGSSVTAFTTTDFTDLIDGLADEYFYQFHKEVLALPAYSRLAAADKDTVVALYKKLVALDDAYDYIWGKASDSLDAVADTSDYTTVEAAYEYFLDKDVADFLDLDGTFTIYKGTGSVYFDASEKNVAALTAARAAYDAAVATYGYADLFDFAAADMDDVANLEAKILAAEYNKTADAGYDEAKDKIDSSKVQAYLNNGTVKVTTQALGSGKIRVKATVDADSFAQIVKEMGEGSTITYQFYYKKAANTTYKAGKVKDVNYTTFKLTKGTKYNFRCKVVITDADGNVVATKDYKASTVGTRTVK